MSKTEAAKTAGNAAENVIPKADLPEASPKPPVRKSATGGATKATPNAPVRKSATSLPAPVKPSMPISGAIPVVPPSASGAIPVVRPASGAIPVVLPPASGPASPIKADAPAAEAKPPAAKAPASITPASIPPSGEPVIPDAKDMDTGGTSAFAEKGAAALAGLSGMFGRVRDAVTSNGAAKDEDSAEESATRPKFPKVKATKSGQAPVRTPITITPEAPIGVAAGATASVWPTGAGQASATRASARTTAPAAVPAAGPRRVRAAVSRVDPFSVMKLGFLLAVAIGIMTVVAAVVFWHVIDNLGIFANVQNLINDAVGPQADIDLMELFAFDQVLSLATIVAVINVVLITAIITLTTVLYNIVAALVGGVHVTLTDD